MRAILLAFAALLVAPSAGGDTQQDVVATHCTGAEPYVGTERLAGAIDLPIAPSSAMPGPLPPEMTRKLNGVLRLAMDRSGANAINAALLVPGQGLWEGRQGNDAREVAAWASAGKTFTAVAMLQLVGEGRLSLDMPVSTWFHDVPNGDAITIRHLLNHTSGLFSANEDRVFRRDPRILTIEEELAIVRRHGAMFCPGSRWRYSNSNYALLGAILERVENKPYARIVGDRIIKPLGLSHTRVAEFADDLADVTPPGPPGQGDIPADPRRAGAAGGIVAPASEIILFWRALLEGRLLGPDLLREAFRDLYPVFQLPEYYGLGVMAYRLPDRLLIGHSGGGAGLKAIVIYDSTRHAFAAVSLSGDKGAEPTANLLLQQLPVTMHR